MGQGLLLPYTAITALQVGLLPAEEYSPGSRQWKAAHSFKSFLGSKPIAGLDFRAITSNKEITKNVIHKKCTYSISTACSNGVFMFKDLIR